MDHQLDPHDHFRDRMKEAIDIAQADGVPWSMILRELLNRIEEVRPDEERASTAAE